MSSDFYNAEMAAKQEKMSKTKDMVRQRAEIMRLLSPSRGETILELGSGNGILVREMLAAVGPKGRVVGLDTSDAILEMSRHICPEGEFVFGDAQDLPFDDATFEAVVAAQLFCFLDDADRAIAETYRVLKQNGRLLVLDTDWDSLIWKSGDPDLMARVMKVYQAVYSDAHIPRSLPSRLAKAGFSNIEVEGFVVLNTGFGEDTYARQSADFATSIMENSSDFTSEEKAAWLDSQEELANTGEFFFSLNRYLVSAHK